MAATTTPAAETDALPISGKQSTTAQPNNSTAERIGDVLAVLTILVLLILGVVAIVLGVVGVWYLFIGVEHLFIGVEHLWSRWEQQWDEWSRPYDPVEYTVTITAVSGLDPATDLLPHPAAALIHSVDPVFNLTLGVASPSRAARRECVEAGTTVEVSYSYLRSGVPLATGAAPAFCVDVGERREEGPIVAWGDGVRLPGFVLDSLAADMLRGAPEFGVKLRPPIPYCIGGRFCSTTVDVISCLAKAGGGPAPCNVSSEKVSFPPLPRPGRERDYCSEANLPQPTTRSRSDA